jgi:hypothetical protein
MGPQIRGFGHFWNKQTDSILKAKTRCILTDEVALRTYLIESFFIEIYTRLQDFSI